MRYITALTSILFLLLTLVAGLIGFWLFQPEEKIVSMTDPVMTDTNGVVRSKFKPGETIHTSRTLIAKRPITHTKVWRTIMRENSNELVFFQDLPPIPYKGNAELRASRIPLPVHLSPGEYRVNMYATYQLNPLREVTYEIEPPIRFEIVK